MDIDKYKKIVKKNLKKDNYFHNYKVAFMSGGLLGMVSQILYLLLNNITINAKAYISIFIILLSSFLTAIGVFDNLISKYRSGLIIPTTGFAHSITSSAMDSKKDGLIKGIGSSFFHLAGSVILYSIVSSFVLVMIKVIFFA